MTSKLLFPSQLRPMTKLLLRLIGAHSFALGLVMLFVPGAALPLMGFGARGADFFTSQSGIFLLILGVCYALAASQPALVSVVVVSKAAAVIFLVVHAGLLGAPASIWAAAAGDGAMLAAVLIALRFDVGEAAERRPAA